MPAVWAVREQLGVAREAFRLVLDASALDWNAQTDDEADIAWSDALHAVREALAALGRDD